MSKDKTQEQLDIIMLLSVSDQLASTLDPHISKLVKQFTEPKQEQIVVMMLSCLLTIDYFIKNLDEVDDKLNTYKILLDEITKSILKDYAKYLKQKDNPAE